MDERSTKGWIEKSHAEAPVVFVAHHLPRRWPELSEDGAVLDMAAVPRTRWAPLESIWIVSTYLRLRSRGYNVRIRSEVQPDRINVCCDEAVVDDRSSYRGFLVLTRGDRGTLPWADFEIVQSPAQKLPRPGALMKHWPQPGLLPRDPTRGNRVETLGYVGPLENLAAAYRTPEFKAGLEALGVELILRADAEAWHDFRDLDLYLAVRDWPWALVQTKPATKLAHSWITGVPALLGKEPAFRFWGADGEDYFEVDSPGEALEVVGRLKQDADLYQAVRRRGREKASEHDEESVLSLWAEVVWGPALAEFRRWRAVGPMEWRRRALRRQVQRATSRVRRRWFYLRAWGWRGLRRGIARRLRGGE